MSRAVYVYRLHVEWPAEALLLDGTLNYQWKPEGWQELMDIHPQLARHTEGDLGEGYWTEFRLPTTRRYLTYDAAQNRLKPFLAIGCKGWVEQSLPVTWAEP